MRLRACAALMLVMLPVAHAEIHKCTDEFGNVAYLQTPCPVEKVNKAEATEESERRTTEAVQREEPPEMPPELLSPDEQRPSSRQPDEQLDACKKRYRDQIDEIDAEIRATFSPEQADEYKARLKILTRQLRACG